MKKIKNKKMKNNFAKNLKHLGIKIKECKECPKDIIYLVDEKKGIILNKFKYN